jgi:hypothetical protein
LTQILIAKKFEKKIVFKSSVLAWIQIRIRIEQKCWIRIRIQSIRIHNPAFICLTNSSLFMFESGLDGGSGYQLSTQLLHGAHVHQLWSLVGWQAKYADVN